LDLENNNVINLCDLNSYINKQKHIMELIPEIKNIIILMKLIQSETQQNKAFDKRKI
jgi:hypothetical protein